MDWYYNRCMQLYRITFILHLSIWEILYKKRSNLWLTSILDDPILDAQFFFAWIKANRVFSRCLWFKLILRLQISWTLQIDHDHMIEFVEQTENCSKLDTLSLDVFNLFWKNLFPYREMDSLITWWWIKLHRKILQRQISHCA